MYNKGARPKPGVRKGFPEKVALILSTKGWIEVMRRRERVERGAKTLEKEMNI